MSDRRVISLRFNQDQGCFTCSMESGVRIYNVDPLIEKAHYDIDTVGSISQCEMLYRTNILAIVSGGVRPKYPDNVLQLYDDSTKEKIMEIKFATSIRAVRLRKDKLIVALLNKIHVFSILHPTQEIFAIETRQNFKGLCEVSQVASAQKQILVFPGHKLGTVQLVDISAMEERISSAPVYISAHQNGLACLALNRTGTRVATASVHGTLIRVWDTTTKKLVVELRRGSDTATVYCISFSKDSDFLCCSSDKGTVHIFALKNTNLNKRMSIPNMGILGKYVESQWGMANFTVPAECACVCAFGPHNSVYALCLDGSFHKYVFNTEGVCYREAFDVYLDVDDDDDF